MCPQRDLLVTSGEREADALVHQPGAQAKAAPLRIDQQQAEAGDARLFVLHQHALWLSTGHSLVIEGIEEGVAAVGRLSPGLWLLFALVLTHLGLALLVTLTSGWPRHPRERAPEIDRNPVDPFARVFVYVFAVVPGLMAIAVALASGRLGPFDRSAPLVVLSGLAVIVAAGDKILLYRERLVSSAWLGLLVAPPVIVALAPAIFP